MSAWQKLKAMTKSSNDCWIGGVCGGLGAATPLPSWMWRAVFVFGFLAFGAGFLVYVALWICLPSEKAAPEQTGGPHASPTRDS
jgi:phage shock protein C